MKTRSLAATAGAIAVSAAGIAAPATAGAASASWVAHGATVRPMHDACEFPGYYWSAKTSEQAFIPTTQPLVNIAVQPGQSINITGSTTRTTSKAYTLSEQITVNGGGDILGIQFGAASATTQSVQWQNSESSTLGVSTPEKNPLTVNAYPYLFVPGKRTQATLYYDSNDPNNLQKCDVRRVRTKTVFLPNKTTRGQIGWVSAEVATPYAVVDRYTTTPVNR